MNRWLGTLNHVSITVSDLDEAMRFFEPVLDFLGYVQRERGNHAGTRLAINLNPEANIAFNIWEAKGDLGKHKFEVYSLACIISPSTPTLTRASINWRSWW